MEKTHLPQEIILEILHRLPFDSLLNCKCVSKRWKNLINHPNFCNLYKPRSSLILTCDRSNLRYYLENTNTNASITTNPSFTWHFLPLLNYYLIPSIEDDGKSELLSGKSNPVACVLLPTGDFLIYNLISGAHINITDAPFRSRWLGLGFGYDGYDKDYKIAVVDEENSLFWVLSLRNLVWKPVKGFPFAKYDFKFGPPGCSLNGVLHWVVLKRGSEEMVILSYDLHTCEFGEVSVPGKNIFTKGYFYELDVYICELDGNLCYWNKDGDVWMMKESSWTHLISLSQEEYSYGHTPTGLYECQNGSKGVLFECGNVYLYWYSLDRGNEKVEFDTRWGKRRAKEEIGKKVDLTYIQKYLLG